MNKYHNRLLQNISVYSIILCFVVMLFPSCEEETEETPTPPTNNTTTSEALSDGDFENWKTKTIGEVSYEVPESEWWGSLNMISTLGSPLTMTKTEDAYSGNYAVKLETVTWGDLAIPGIITAGYFDPDQPITENLMLGRPFSKDPICLIGYFKYQSANQDTMVMYTNLTRFNTETNTRDTIAAAEYTIDISVDEFTKFELIYDYYINDVMPDTINVLFLTSASGQQFLGHIGSELIIDNVELVFKNDK